MPTQKIEIKRHSCAHIMAAAIRNLWPDTQFGVGPVVENGFYYDIRSKHTIKEAELAKIEAGMKKIIKSKSEFKKEELSFKKAKALFKKNNQPFKIELIGDVEKHGTTDYDIIHKNGASKSRTKSTGGKVSIYHASNFTDLCRGPHIQNTKELNPDAFKLVKIAGAYWRGDENNPQLQRIYGVVFNTKEELETHLTLLEEAKKRDHRKLGVDLDLFLFSNLVGPGLPLWTPKGTLLRNLLDDFIWKLRKERGYEQVDIPHLTKKDLYEKSGHWEKFKDELFQIQTREGHMLTVKPMNCPHHTQIYNRRPRSYRELPVRYANTTKVYRDEQTGELAGLARVRAITQDDAHVFCRNNQVKDEILKIWDIVEKFYGIFGFSLQVRLSLHDPKNPKLYLGTPKLWNEAENQLRAIARQKKTKSSEQTGEAAFYGPKVDFVAKDSLGREWQVATIQLDMNMPERFDLACINEKGEKERIVMIHAAIMGSIERFIAILLEHYAGALPFWLSPTQVKILTINDKVKKYAQDVNQTLQDNEIRTELDDRNESIGKKIREAELLKTPYLLIIGGKEVSAKTVSVRQRSRGDTGSTELKSFLGSIKKELK